MIHAWHHEQAVLAHRFRHAEFTEAMQAAADIGYIPQRKRFEQILVRQGSIAINILDDLQKELALLRESGRVVSLEEELVERELCTVEEVTQAIRLAGYSVTKG